MLYFGISIIVLNIIIIVMIFSIYFVLKKYIYNVMFKLRDDLVTVFEILINRQGDCLDLIKDMTKLTNSDLNHIHLLIECTPQHFIPDILKALKGVSARILMREFGVELKNKLCNKHLWNPSYFIATVSENTEDQIKKYIESQKEK